jgi:hypothetical protein
VLGTISWRGPFFGVSVLMTVALLVTVFLLPSTVTRSQPTSWASRSRPPASGTAGRRADRAVYNFGFFTLLAYTLFPLNMNAHQVGLVFFGWAWRWPSPRWSSHRACSSAGVPCLRSWPPWSAALVLVAMAVWTEHRAVLVAGVVVAGLFLGINNTLVTETVMNAAAGATRCRLGRLQFRALCQRLVALAGFLGERINDHVPYWVGAALAGAAAGAGVLAFSRRHLLHVDTVLAHGAASMPLDRPGSTHKPTGSTRLSLTSSITT